MAPSTAPSSDQPPRSGAAVEQADLHRLLIESVVDYAIFALDSDGHILSWNPGAQRFKGYTADEIIGRHFSVFYTEDARAAGHPDYELEVATREGRYEEEGWRIKKDGSRFWASVTITALRDPDGHVVGFAKVTRDLTERMRAQEQAIEDTRRVAEAEAANRAKLQFLASLSHELRTPLNAIGGYVDLILNGVRGPVSTLVTQDLERVRDSQQHLLGLINDLLNFSRIEAGGMTYSTESFSVASVVESVVALLQPQAHARGITLACSECPLGLSARADVNKVEQILLNLVSNALKFTQSGGRVTLACRAVHDRIEVDVADTGCGIPADEQQVIFDAFVQLGRSLTSSHEGTGLGLSISRDLARGMNGDLRVESRVDHGSTFTLELPAG